MLLQLLLIGSGCGGLTRKPLRPTDDPPQPRCAPWVEGLAPPPEAIDPRRISVLPASVPPNSTNASSDDGLSPGATPNVYVYGDSSYTMGVVSPLPAPLCPPPALG